LTGLVIHSVFTGRMPLVTAWVLGFVLQAQVRAYVFGVPPIVPLTPMTSAAFILFTLYMIPDPATTPLHPWRQALFGFSVAMVYGLLQVLHVVFGLFFALVAVCAIRGLSLHLYFAFKAPAPAPTRPASAPASLPGTALQGAAQP
jgi:enediyne biosynthesis protein E5